MESNDRIRKNQPNCRIEIMKGFRILSIEPRSKWTTMVSSAPNITLQPSLKAGFDSFMFDAFWNIGRIALSGRLNSVVRRRLKEIVKRFGNEKEKK